MVGLFIDFPNGAKDGRSAKLGIIRAKKAIKKAFQLQQEGAGFTLVEVLSTCPTNWGLTPNDSLDWLEKNMIPVFPLGVYRDISAKEK